jgi:chromosome segregation ATPase
LNSVGKCAYTNPATQQFTLKESEIKMEIVTIMLGLALVGALAYIFFGQKPALQSTSSSNNTSRTETAAPRKLVAADDVAKKLESELNTKRKELDDLRKTHGDQKEELKAAKKKLHDLKEGNKDGDDLAKARVEVERQASIQLDSTRAELATALADVQRLKTEAELRGQKKKAFEDAPKVVEVVAAAPKPQEVITRVIRELSDSEKERIHKLESQSANDRKKANELDREIKSIRVKFDKHTRDSKRIYGEADMARAKFRAVEMRLNRTLLENDMVKRALVDLQKKSGITAERFEPSAEEIAKSDATMKEKHATEDRLESENRARLEAAEATQGEAAVTPAVEAAKPVATA